MSEGDIEVSIEIRTATGVVTSRFSGTPEEVLKGVTRFLSESLPAFSIAQRISLRFPSPDELVDLLGEDIKISGKEILFLKKPTDAAEGIRKALIASRVSFDLGQTDTPALSVRDLSRITLIAEKTVNNNLTELVKTGSVERVSKGTYKITDGGLLRTFAIPSKGGEK